MVAFVSMFRQLLLLPALLLTLFALPNAARADDAAVQTAWRLLDYIAVDYRGAVAGGRVIEPERICRDARILRLGDASGSARCRPMPAKAALGRRRARARGGGRAQAPPAEVDRLARGLGAPAARRLSGAAGAGGGARPRARRPALRRELRVLPRRDRRRRHAAWRASSIRRRSPSPTATAPASAACSRSTR